VLNFETLEKILGAHEPAPIRLDAARCLNRRHKARACAECQACPTDAIVFADGVPTALDETKCVTCGLCASVCPSGAFATHPHDAALLDAVAAYPIVELACKRATETRAPNVERVMTVACLARLNHDVLVALGAEHARAWLNDVPCAECPIGARAYPRIVALVNAARRTLSAWQRDMALALYTLTEAELGTPRALTQSAPTELSRRELFSFLRGNLGRAAGMVVAATLNVAPSQAPSTPAFERAQATLGVPPANLTGERFATIRVDEACTACGLCAKQCPTRAIEFRADAGYFVLDFHAHQCLGTACRICELYCLPRVLTIEPGVASQVWHAREPIHLRTGQLALCTKCQTAFALVADESLCPTCRNEKNKWSALARDLFKPPRDATGQS